MKSIKSYVSSSFLNLFQDSKKGVNLCPTDK